MKNKIKFLMFFVGVLLMASPAFALQCKDGNFGPDECWTEVEVSRVETTPVIAGTVLVYDFTSNEGSSETAAFRVRVATASADAYKVAGIAQKTIATGDRGRVLVRGKGLLRVAGITASGDRLFTSSTAGVASNSMPAGNTVASRDRNIAFALETESAAATTDAFITIV